jgi:hypothetical protein
MLKLQIPAEIYRTASCLCRMPGLDNNYTGITGRDLKGIRMAGIKSFGNTFFGIGA